jgi:chemotaxis protein CheX
MNDTYINSFLESCSTVLNQYDIVIKSGKPHLKESYQLADKIIILIGVTGKFKGQVLFNLGIEPSLNIVSQMMGGYEAASFDDMAKSAISELVNMILENTATNFYNHGVNIDITPPSLLMGDNMSLTPQHPTICIPIELSVGGSMELDIMLKEDDG